jgi:hypothetical protein
VIVTLDEADVEYARRLGRERYDERLATLGAGTIERRNVVDGLPAHCWGALGEVAYARAFDLALPTSGPDLEGDLIPGLQIRHTTYRSGRLIVHPYEPDHFRFVLVRGLPPTLELVGWIMGADAKQRRYWRDDVPIPAYFVPAAELAPLDAAYGGTLA